MANNSKKSGNKNKKTSNIGKMDEKEKRKMKKLVKELSKLRGRHTELVSVYIPAGYSITDVIGQLKNEQGTASNIKSKATRKNVMSALEKIIQHLRVFKATPEKGLVVFSGNVSETEGKEDIKLWSFEPPEPMRTKIYWCDQTFVLDPLEEMVREREVYALIVLDARDANIGLLVGKSIKPLKHIESTVPSKTVKGGMSQHRYDRLREDAINEFLTKVGETANQLLLKDNLELKGMIIGGPGPVKERFAKGKYLNYMLLKKNLGVKDVGYTSDFGLQELVERSEDLLKESAISHEKEVLGKFFTALQKDGLVTYGIEEVKQTLKAGTVDTLLISEDFDWVRVNFECQCGEQLKKDIPRQQLKKDLKCPKCKGWMKPDKGEMLELTDVFEEMARNTGAKVEHISNETREGVQFKELGGLGAILRFKLG
jgi:peptide chain release factor subunit 1